MCCFSREIEAVNNTRIFARQEAGGRQFVIYAMSISSNEDVAMVLPLPVTPGSGEKALTFINLEKYPKLFDDMSKGFDESEAAADPFGAAPDGSRAALEVEQVGAFEASYVPSVADFSRLDPRFQLPPGTWEKLPGYASFGFAVFKLRKGKHNVHPMAFSFPSATPDKLFFPTLHIHDGVVHEKAVFDHTLYCQGSGLKHSDWTESPGVPLQFMKAGLTQGIMLPAQHLYRRTLSGQLANTDWLVKSRAMV